LFVTMPHFEQFMPDPAQTGQQWWRAVSVFATSHWFVFVYESDWEGQKVPESALVADEWTLLSLLAKVSPEDRKALGRVEKQGARWQLRWVDALWIPAAAELEGRGVLLFQFEGDGAVRDRQMRPVEPQAGRRLLYRSPAVEAQRQQTTPFDDRVLEDMQHDPSQHP